MLTDKGTERSENFSSDCTLQSPPRLDRLQRPTARISDLVEDNTQELPPLKYLPGDPNEFSSLHSSSEMTLEPKCYILNNEFLNNIP